MNSSGSQFLLLHDADDFRTDRIDTCNWDDSLQVLRLDGDQQGRFARRPLPNALAAWLASPPRVIDPQGQIGFLSQDRRSLCFSLDWPVLPGSCRAVTASSTETFADSLEELALQPVQPPQDTAFTDLHLGGDGRVALAFSDHDSQHGLLVMHLARRWQSRCRLFAAPLRVCVDPLNRVWVAGSNWLGLCAGEPLPQPYTPDKAARFEPLQSNPHPLRQLWADPMPTAGAMLGMCCDSERLYLLLWRQAENEYGFRQLILSRPLHEDQQADYEIHHLPASLPFATDIASLGPRRLALMLPQDSDKPDALDLPVIELPPIDQAEADKPLQAEVLAERYPQHSQLNLRLLDGMQDASGHNARFVVGMDGKVRYPAQTEVKQLHRLPQARYRQRGKATLNEKLDSGSPDTLWHKIYLEACIPPGCELEIAVKPFEDYAQPGSDWQRQAAPLWLARASELPFYQGRFESKPGHQGLFEILLQREDGEVREIRGRYLQIAVSMKGDGRHSPAIHAMRVYYPRHCWQQAYLPQHFHQQQRPDPDQRDMPGNGADLRGRMLAVAESLLTPIEDQVGAAETWAFPEACPSDHLPRLAASLGTELPRHWPEARQRRWLANRGALSEQHGTLRGLCLALDIATDGGVQAGHVIPVENYRLRRTMATILGLDMDDAEHPLTLGTGQSGNSRVGDSLILSDEDSKEFLALFAPELAKTKVERKQVDDFFDNYAHRLSIVLHGPARAQRHTVERLLQQEAPAHLQWVLIETDHPFVLGLSPLLGIDTYLQTPPPWRNVVLGDTRLTREGILRNPVALSPRHTDGINPTPRGES